MHSTLLSTISDDLDHHPSIADIAQHAFEIIDLDHSGTLEYSELKTGCNTISIFPVLLKQNMMLYSGPLT